MCLIRDEKITAKLIDKMKRNGGKLKAWKTYMVCYDGSVVSVWQKVQVKPSRLGVIRSNRPSKALSRIDVKAVSRGIHVYVSPTGPKHMISREFNIPVTCDTRDLVAAGYNLLDSRNSAVFMKVRVDPEQLKRLAKRTYKRAYGSKP